MNINMISFMPARGDDGKIDFDATFVLAKKAALKFAEQDDPRTANIGEAAIKVWNEKPFENTRSISLNALARMALNHLGVMPDDKSCKDAAGRIQSVLMGQSDKFLILRSGPHKGVHYRSRYNQDELNALLAESNK